MRILSLVFFLSFNAYGLVPLEGLLLGNVQEDLQIDPLFQYFSNTISNDESYSTQKILSKRIQAVYLESEILQNSCSKYRSHSYSSDWDERQAKRAAIAHLQWRALDQTVKSIGHYSKLLQMSEEDYNEYASKLVDQNCSPNITVYGLKFLKQNLLHHFKENGHQSIDDALDFSPYLSERVKSKNSLDHNLYYASKVFRAFCSWGGDPTDLRMLTPYMKDPLIVSWLGQEMEGNKLFWNELAKKWEFIHDDKNTRVACRSLVCRESNSLDFKNLFPRLLGSISVQKDLGYLYCEKWKFGQYDRKSTHPHIQKWIKEQSEEDDLFEVSWLQMRILEIPSLWSTMDKFNDNQKMLFSGIDLRAKTWANLSLEAFKRIFFLEESIEIRPVQEEFDFMFHEKTLALSFTATLGEMDRIFQTRDKISSLVKLKVSHNYLQWMRRKWKDLSNKLDENEIAFFQSQVNEVVKIQLKSYGEKWPFHNAIDGVSLLISKELITKVIYSDEKNEILGNDQMIEIPIKFYFGLNALQYMSLKT